MTDPRFTLVLEFIQRLRAGEALSVEDFQAEHPEAGPEIAPILREAAGWSQNGDTNTLQIRLEESGLFAGKSDGSTGLDTIVVQDPAPDVSFDKRYRKRRLLGEGGYGKVFLVEDTMHHAEKLALKVIRKVHTTGEVDQRFRNEIRVLRALNHGSIPMIFNDGTTAEGEIYYTMTYVQGRTLEQIIREESPLEPERIYRFAQQLLDVLAYAHDEGVVHRDLKPSNIIVENPGTASEQVQVLDFGIAKVLRHEGLLEQAQTMLTEVPLGTPHYMAPEQVRGQGEDGRTDIYSLGTIIYQMCSGRLPFQGKTSMEILIARLEQTPSDLTSEEAPKWLRETIRRCLKRDREKRPTAREAQTFIARARGEQKAKTPVGKLILLAGILLAIPAVLFFFGTGPLDVFKQRTETVSLTPDPKDGPDRSPLTPNSLASESGTPQDSIEDSEAGAPPEDSMDEPPLADVDRGSHSESSDESAATTDESSSSLLPEGLDEQVAGETTGEITDGSEESTDSEESPSSAGSNGDSELEEVETPGALTANPDESPTTVFSPTAQVRVARLNAQRELHTQEGEPVISCEVEDLNQVGSMLAPQGDELSAGPDERVEEGRAELQLRLGSSGSFDIALFDGKTWNGDSKSYDSEPVSTFSVVIDRDEPEGQILEPGQTLPPSEDASVRYLIGDAEITMRLQVEDRLPGRVSMPLASLEGNEIPVIQPEGFANSDSPEIVTFDIPIQLDREGAHRFETTAFDEAGNISEQACVLVRDMTPPAIALSEHEAIEGEGEGSAIDAGTETSFFLRGQVTDVHPARLLLLRGGEERPLPFVRRGESNEYAFEIDLVDLEIGANPMELVAYDQIGRSSKHPIVVTRYPLPLPRLSFSVRTPEETAVYAIDLQDPQEGTLNAIELPALEDAMTRMLLTTPRSEVELSADGEEWLAAGETLAVDLPEGESTLHARIRDIDELVRRAYTIAVEVLPARKPQGTVPMADSAVMRIGDAFYYERVTNTLEGVDMPFVLVPPPGSASRFSGLPPFYLGEREVSYEQFSKALPTLPEEWVAPTDSSLPVTRVLFAEAAGFCQAIGAQLPSAEEWSWAARGPEDFEYAWGDDWRRDGCNANERDEHDGLAPSGSYPLDRSWCGALDLTANATEWCRDASGRSKCTGGSYLRGRDVCSFARPLGSSSKRRENLGFRALMLVD